MVDGEMRPTSKELIVIANNRLAAEPVKSHWEGCYSDHWSCLVAHLVRALNDAEARRDFLDDRLQAVRAATEEPVTQMCVCGRPMNDGHDHPEFRWMLSRRRM
jgi:hypothetical protein